VKKPQIEDVVGEVNESRVFLNDIPCTALIDTGSQVTTLSESFWNCQLVNCPIQPLDDIIEVEGAGGQKVPFLGFIEVSISFPQNVNGILETMNAVVLIVPDTRFNLKTPLLVGTNLIRRCKDSCAARLGPCFLQRIRPDTAWMVAYRHLGHQERALRKSTQVLRVQNEPGTPMLVQSQRSTVIWTKIRTTKVGGTFPTLIDDSNSELPKPLQVVPSLVEIEMNGKSQIIPVEVLNPADKPVILQARTIIGKLHPVSLISYESSVSSSGQDSLIHNNSVPSAPSEFPFSPHLTEDQKSQASQMLNDWNRRVFAQSDFDLGCTGNVKHSIPVTDHVPFKQRHRRIPPAQYEEVRKHIQEMLNCGVIRESHSPWSSPVVLVRKRDGGLRFCVDFRKLNARTIKDSYSLPRIDEALESMSGSAWFSTLDLKSGYWQLEVEEGDKAKTAFTVGPLGFFEFNRMAFGLTNAPATFQRLMEHCMGELNFKKCLVYIDDIIVFAKTFEEHKERLQAVFEKLETFGLKLKPSKCSFFQNSVKYLGHVISADGIATDPDKINAIRTWPTPTKMEELRTFLGFAGYYRKFVSDYAKLVKPLNDLLARLLKPNGPAKPAWSWSPHCDDAFNEVVEILTSPPVLAYPDFEKPFILNIDASQDGLGATLCQSQNDSERVISFGSRGLRKAEKNYSGHKLEFLCLKWAVTEKFHEYLYGRKFTVRTDNNPLTYVTTTAKLDATGHRWLAALSTYDFELVYRPGRRNQDADGLSRRPHPSNREVVNSDVVTALCKNQGVPAVETVCCSVTGTDDIMDNLSQPSFTKDDLKAHQERDPVLGKFIPWLKKGKRPTKTDVSREGLEFRILMTQWERLSFKEGVLYRRCKQDTGENWQLVVPQDLRTKVFEGIHDKMGHFSIDKTSTLAHKRFYWPGMTKELNQRIKSCGPCVMRKSQPREVPLVSITTTEPLELVCIDYLKLERSKGGYENILVITDHFTRYAQAIPTTNQTAITTAKALFDKFIVHYGFPSRLHSDQELCQIAGVQKSRTTPYHPMDNGMTERYNRTLLNMLGTLSDARKANWKDYVAPLVHAYNSTKHDSTGFSPFYLMFGREPRIPVDVQFGLDPNSSHPTGRDSSKFVENLRKRLNLAYDLATKNAQVASKRNKVRYDAKRREAKLLPGDRVLVRNSTPSGKLDNKWEKEVYVVDKKPNEDIPVYIIRREDGVGRKRTLHRNLLLPCPLPLYEMEQKPTSQRPRKEFAVRSPRSVETPESDEEDNNQYAIRLRERHGGNENTPLRASTEDVSMTHTSPLDREIPSGTPEDVSMTHTSPLDREIPSGTPEDVSTSRTSPRNAQETAFGNVSERESPLEVESPPEPRPRRVRHPPRWMADPNWVCYQHTVPTMPATSTIIHVFFPHLCILPAYFSFPLPPHFEREGCKGSWVYSGDPMGGKEYLRRDRMRERTYEYSERRTVQCVSTRSLKRLQVHSLSPQIEIYVKNM